MRKLIESTHVSAGGEIGSPQSAFTYLNETQRLRQPSVGGSGRSVAGRLTDEGLAAAYPTMSAGGSEVLSGLIDRMNSLPKYGASTTLRETAWNATVIDGTWPRSSPTSYDSPAPTSSSTGTGPLDATLMEHDLIDEFHLLMTPVAVGRRQHRFEDIDTAPALNLVGVTRFGNGVQKLVYTPT